MVDVEKLKEWAILEQYNAIEHIITLQKDLNTYQKTNNNSDATHTLDDIAFFEGTITRMSLCLEILNHTHKDTMQDFITKPCRKTRLHTISEPNP